MEKPNLDKWCIDISKIVVSNKVLFGKKGLKYSIGYKDGKKCRSLFVMLPKISVYRRNFEETKYMSFFVKDYELLEIYKEIWDKASKFIKRELVVSLYIIINILKTKVKSYKGKVNTNFHDDKMPKEDSQ